MTARPPRKTNPLLRVVMSAVLVAFAVFVVQYQKSTEHPQLAANAPAKPFLSTAPSSEGSNRFAWVPHYPGATIENISTKQTRDELTYGFNFRTADDFKQTLAFYSAQLQSAGFKVKMNDSGDHGGDLHADAVSGDRSFDIVAVKVLQGAGTEVGVTAVQR
ncbi:MAG: hypothetical protein M3N22_10375 [Acidobacteriota bacterium]|nr:hypothetical protein [Acidobacteriota bacterium]